MKTIRPLVGALLALVACAGRDAATPTPAEPALTDQGAFGSTPGSPEGRKAAAKADSAAPSPREAFVSWLAPRLPKGGAIDEGSGEVTLHHTAAANETWDSIARAYLDLTDVYFAADLAKELRKDNRASAALAGPKEGTSVAITHLLTEPYKTGDEARIGWPEDKALRGIYLRDDTYGRFFRALESMPPRGMNAIVLDTKDYDGLFTYRTKNPIALETGAAKNAPIRDLARLIRFAHAKGVRVVARVACFHDPYQSSRLPALSIQGNWGKPYPIGWLDPGSADVHKFILDVVSEVLDAGIDEVQLDYIRFPVQPGLKNAVLAERGEPRKTVIRDFVREVHALTKPRGASLSLDVFGVIAFGMKDDLDNLGQDLTWLATECEALSPMVYPSHYDKGFRGWDEPGNHPEIVGIGAKAATAQLASIKGAAVIRPWLQAFSWKSPDYGVPYLAEEVKSADSGGAVGWLMWNPAQAYDIGYRAVPSQPPHGVKSAPAKLPAPMAASRPGTGQPG